MKHGHPNTTWGAPPIRKVTLGRESHRGSVTVLHPVGTKCVGCGDTFIATGCSDVLCSHCTPTDYEVAAALQTLYLRLIDPRRPHGRYELPLLRTTIDTLVGETLGVKSLEDLPFYSRARS